MKCTGIGRIVGHWYQPRESVRKTYRQDASGTERQETREYHGDVCARCGHRLGESEPELVILRNDAIDGVTGEAWVEGEHTRKRGRAA